MKWPSAAPKTRDAMTDALATLIPALTSEPPPDGIDPGTLREALRHYALAPPSRTLHRPPTIVAALRWLEKTSLPVSLVSKPQHARAALDAISVRMDGRAASATTIARKRSVFANAIRYAVELEEMPSNPLDRLSWKPPKVSEVVDRRVVVNPRQARELLTAVTYVGQQRRGPLRARPAAHGVLCVHVLRRAPARRSGRPAPPGLLPARVRLGRLTLEKSRPEVNRRWTDTGSAHSERGLKHRAAEETRRVPIPPELVAILRTHIATFGVAPRRPGVRQRPGPARRLHRHQRRLGRGPDPGPDPRPGRLSPCRPPLRPAPRSGIALAGRRRARTSRSRAGRAQRRSPAPRLRQVPRRRRGYRQHAHRRRPPCATPDV